MVRAYEEITYPSEGQISEEIHFAVFLCFTEKNFFFETFKVQFGVIESHLPSLKKNVIYFTLLSQ